MQGTESPFEVLISFHVMVLAGEFLSTEKFFWQKQISFQLSVRTLSYVMYIVNTASVNQVCNLMLFDCLLTEWTQYSRR